MHCKPSLGFTQVPFTDCGLDLGWSDPHAGPRQTWPAGDCYHQCCNSTAASVPTTPAHVLIASPPSASAVLFGRRHLQETSEIADAVAKDDNEDENDDETENQQNGAANVTAPALIDAKPLPRLVKPCPANSRLFGPCEGDRKTLPGIWQG